MPSHCTDALLTCFTCEFCGSHACIVLSDFDLAFRRTRQTPTASASTGLCIGEVSKCDQCDDHGISNSRPVPGNRDYTASNTVQRMKAEGLAYSVRQLSEATNPMPAAYKGKYWPERPSQVDPPDTHCQCLLPCTSHV